MAPAPASPGLLDACGLDPDARRGLGRFSLIDDTGGGWKKMHRLVQAFGRKGDTTGAEKAFFAGCGSRGSTIQLSTGYKVYLEDAPHLTSAMAGSEQWGWVEVGDRIGLLRAAETGLQSAGRAHESRKLSQDALSLALDYFGESHPAVASCRSNLALVLKSLGDLEGAKVLLEKALESDLRSFGPDHPVAGGIRRSNLATVLMDLGDLIGAKALLELALASDVMHFGTHDPRVAIRRSNLALVLSDLGDLEGAKVLLQQALESGLEDLGSEHPSIAVWRSNLATVLMDLGDLEAASAQATEARRVALLMPAGVFRRDEVLRVAGRITSNDD